MGHRLLVSKGAEIVVGRERLREMGFPVSDTEPSPLYGTFTADEEGVTINISPPPDTDESSP